MTLGDYCRQLGWSAAELARQAGIDTATAGKAMRGEEISRRVARKIASALSEALGVSIQPGEIAGLNVQ